MLFVMQFDKELVKNSHQHLGNEANATLRYFLTFLEAWKLSNISNDANLIRIISVSFNLQSTIYNLKCVQYAVYSLRTAGCHTPLVKVIVFTTLD